MGQNRFKNFSKFQKFQLSNFTLTCSNEGKMNSVPPNCCNITATKNENNGQTYVIVTGLQPRTTQFVNERSTIWPNWEND